MFSQFKNHQQKILIAIIVLALIGIVSFQFKIRSQSKVFKQSLESLSLKLESNLNTKADIKTDDSKYLVEDLAQYFLARIDFLERSNTVLQNAFLSLEQGNRDPDFLKEKICNSIIEDGVDPTEISKGYDCLAQLELKKNNSASIYRAIKYESLALEAFYTKKYQQNLLAIITNVPVIEKLEDFDEYAFLDKLSKSKDTDVASRALYRMSLIKSLGRASSVESYNFDLIKSSNLKRQAQKLTSFQNRKSVDVLFSLNDNEKYVNYAKTTIASILLNADLDSDYNFYVIMDSQEPISTEHRALLNSLQSMGSYKIEFITLPKDILDHANPSFSSPRVRVSFQKFVVENVLNKLDSVINLDVDIIVLRDLYKLQHQEDFGQNIFAGASEPLKLGRNRLCDLGYDYINTGVIVQNLKLMREVKNSTYLINQYQKEYKSKDQSCFAFRDQDALNIIYKDKMKPISRRWNSPVIGWNNTPISVDIHTPFMPFIIHFTGEKPSKEAVRQESLLYLSYEELANYESSAQPTK